MNSPGPGGPPASLILSTKTGGGGSFPPLRWIRDCQHLLATVRLLDDAAVMMHRGSIQFFIIVGQRSSAWRATATLAQGISADDVYPVAVGTRPSPAREAEVRTIVSPFTQSCLTGTSDGLRDGGEADIGETQTPDQFGKLQCTPSSHRYHVVSRAPPLRVVAGTVASLGETPRQTTRCDSRLCALPRRRGWPPSACVPDPKQTTWTSALLVL